MSFPYVYLKGCHWRLVRQCGRARWLTIWACAFSLAGCASYQLRGRVVEGPAPSISVVDKHDPRLDEPGLAGAMVNVTIDPQSLNRKRLSPERSESDGSFAVPVPALGAGVLEYKVRVTAQLKGYQSADNIFPLPGSGKRVLITLPTGRDVHPPQTEDFLDQTLKMSEPYLRGQ